MKANKACLGNLVRNIMIWMEVLLCVTALLLLVFRHTVEGSETEETGISHTEISVEAENAGESPVTEDWTEAEDLQEPAAADHAEDTEDTEDTDLPADPEETETDPSDKPEEDPEEIQRRETAERMRNDWRLVLSNKNHYIATDFQPELVNVSGRYQADERIADDLKEMITAAKEDGIYLQIVSAYRDINRQQRLFDRKVRKYQRSGMSYSEAVSEASKTVAVPGTSEHQLGLALDIVGSGHSALTESFADTKAGQWLAAHCSEYGFILRYPKGKEEITGIIFEPWHFRYVGKDYAEEITESGLTLEEYLKENGVD